MLHLLKRLKTFASDERGAFAAMFGLMSVVMIALSGAIVDYVHIEQSRNRAQVALDAAALTLQPNIYTTAANTLKTQAQNLVIERVDDDAMGIVVEKAVVNTNNGTLGLEARLTMNTIFVSLIGVPVIQARVSSQATRKKLAAEVVMVLDNSLSMAQQSRISNLRTAATSATNILFTGTANPGANPAVDPKVRIGIVPFTLFVNVGASHSGDDWIDVDGISPVANDNFDDDDDDSTPFTDPVNRLDLFANMVNEPWQGCVEARPYPYSVDDTLPDSSNPGTLFVPAFAPDEPNSGYYNTYVSDTPNNCAPTPTWIWTQVKTKCNQKATSSNTYNNATCNGGTTTNTYNQLNWDGSITHPSSQPAMIHNNLPTGPSDNYSGSRISNNNYTNTRVRTYTYYYSDRELQERLCKYSGSNPSFSGFGKGPNGDCPSNALLPLTNSRDDVLNKITAMQAEGGTNIHQGAIWGFHLLSPTEPFTEGDAYDTATAKTMILMTDGENLYWDQNNMNGTYYYMPYGYLWDAGYASSGRPGTYGTDNAISMEAKIDTLTEESCASAKLAGIEVYTVALSPPTQGTIDMMTNCATDPSHAYFPATPAELNTVFTAIAQQLADLRIAQ